MWHVAGNEARRGWECGMWRGMRLGGAGNEAGNEARRGWE